MEGGNLEDGRESALEEKKVKKVRWGEGSKEEESGGVKVGGEGGQMEEEAKEPGGVGDIGVVLRAHTTGEIDDLDGGSNDVLATRVEEGRTEMLAVSFGPTT